MNQKVIYLEIDSDISTTVSEIRKSHSEEVLLFLPRGATSFRSRMNLKLLKKSAREAKKKLTIITPDQKVRSILKEIKIKSMDELPIDTESKLAHVARPVKPQPRHKPEPESVESEKKFSISAFLASERKKKKNPFSEVREVSTDASGVQSFSLSHRSPSKFALAGFFFGSLLLLFFVSSLVFPSATITITPVTSEVSVITNFLFGAYDKNPLKVGNFVSTKNRELELMRTITFPSTGKKFIGRKSRGAITIYNAHPRPKTIIPSRFQSEDGLIYWTQEEITLPARAEDGTPGEITVTVVADDFDIEGRPQGDRANLAPGNKFHMPAIPFLSPQFYWAENKKPIAGGAIKTEKVLTEDDIRFGREKTIETLKQELKTSLIKRLRKENLTLLDFPQAIEYEILSVDVPEAIEQTVDDFTVTARMKIKAQVYAVADFERVILPALESKVHPYMRLHRLNPDNLDLRFLKMEGEKQPVLRVEADLRARQSYTFGDSGKGQKLADKVRRRVLGLSTEQAESLILDLPEVDEVSISMSPFFMSSLPIVAGNVEVVSVYDR